MDTNTTRFRTAEQQHVRPRPDRREEGVSQTVDPLPAVPTVIIEARSGWRLFDWKEIVHYRDLLYFLVLRDVTVLYKQTVLGIAWAVLTPFFSMVVFSVIFGTLLK